MPEHVGSIGRHTLRRAHFYSLGAAAPNPNPVPGPIVPGSQGPDEPPPDRRPGPFGQPGGGR